MAWAETGQVLTVYTPGSPADSSVVLEPAQNTQAQRWTGMSNGCDTLLTTVTNGTGNALSLTANAVEGTTNLSGSIPLPPNTTVTILSGYNDGLATGFGVWDRNYSTTDSVASFAVHQHECFLSAVRSIPGGLKNAIDWLVSGEQIINKPIALLHASHRGDDMLAGLRTVLATITDRFARDIFLRLHLMKMEPAEVFRTVETPENRSKVQAYLQAFSAYCVAESETA